MWRSGRVAEGAPLLREYTLIAYRGFESLLLRHKQESPPSAGFFVSLENSGFKRTLWFDRMRPWEHLAPSATGTKPVLSHPRCFDF
jgi:hypothetical protein